MWERGTAPLTINLCTRGVLGFTPSLPYPWVKSGEESGYAVELVLGAVQMRKIYDCDAMLISIKVPPSGGACFLRIPAHLCSLQEALWKNWVLCNRKTG